MPEGFQQVEPDRIGSPNDFLLSPDPDHQFLDTVFHEGLIGAEFQAIMKQATVMPLKDFGKGMFIPAPKLFPEDFINNMSE